MFNSIKSNKSTKCQAVSEWSVFGICIAEKAVLIVKECYYLAVDIRVTQKTII